MQTVDQIKGQLCRRQGSRVRLRAYRSRRRALEHDGVLERCFESVFTVLIEQGGRRERVSYTYQDVYTRRLELSWVED
ncbi:MAG: hypothetical protein IJP30_00485 [Clostridia bacterium]|nr:hypothetical protein [Clostridia bacterium]